MIFLTFIQNCFPGWLPISRLGTFLKDRLIWINLILSLVFNLITLAVLWFLIKPTQASIALHYNIYYGIDLIGPRYKVFLISLTGLTIFFINLVISYIIYKRARLMSYLLAGASSLVGIFLLLAAVMVVLINV